MVNKPQETYKLADYDLSYPLVAAAGFQNGVDQELIIEKFNELLGRDVGAITLGSFTLPQNDGNEIKFGSPVYYYDRKNQKAYNSIGLANIGFEEGVKLTNELVPKAHDRGKLVIISGSPLAAPEHGTSVEQALKLAEKFLKTVADLVELNLSCPNIVTEEGRRKPIMGYDLISVEELLVGLSKMDSVERIGLKMPPYLTAEEKGLIPRIAELLARYPVGFLTVCNTIPNQIPLDEAGEPIFKQLPGHAAGMSGPATKEVGQEQLGLWKEAMPDIDIISLLGVDSMDEVNLRLKMGATAAGGVTFFREKLF